MDSAQLVIAVLVVACLAVFGAIVFVLRSSGRRADHEASSPALPVGELAQRIRAAQPPQLRQQSGYGPSSFAESSPFGRMPDVSDVAAHFERSDAGLTASGDWNLQQRPPSPWPPVAQAAQNAPSAPAGWPMRGAQSLPPGSGPLAPQPGGSPLSPLPRFGGDRHDPRGPGAPTSVTSGALGPGPAWLSPAGNVPAGSLGSSSGRIPGFALEDTLAAVLRQLPWQPDQSEVQRLRDAATVYDDGLHVTFDPQCDALDLVFAACPLGSPAEVALAFHMLNDRFQAVLGPMGRDRAALLVDVAGLDIRAEVTEVWVQSLREFLLARCAQAGPSRFLLARYNSRVRSTADRRESLQRIQTATLAAALSTQTRIFGSRDEAIALIARLRELAAVTG